METGQRHNTQMDCRGVAESMLAVIAMLVLLPLFAILALLVKLTSRGPVFYTAHRLGLNGTPLAVHKFRTMHEDADTKLENILSSSSDHAGQWAAKYKMENDPRVTPFGHFLRRTSLDELPQLWEVACGKMSFVGPRPIRPAEIEKYGSRYELLKTVKPGMTGLWQVSGRSLLSYEERIALDMRYIRERNLKMDMSIILRTIPEVLFGRGAY